ncbi:MAG: hypothetical protein KBT41_01900 [bacterium]|nr:hypothetical protein [Candidatus Colousia faecequi]
MEEKDSGEIVILKEKDSGEIVILEEKDSGEIVILEEKDSGEIVIFIEKDLGESEKSCTFAPKIRQLWQTLYSREKSTGKCSNGRGSTRAVPH